MAWTTFLTFDASKFREALHRVQDMTSESGAFQDSDNTNVVHLIEQELEQWGPSVQEVHVEVQDQLVTLSGTVGSYYLKQVAQETVWHVRPDLQVINGIQVKPR